MQLHFLQPRIYQLLDFQKMSMVKLCDLLQTGAFKSLSFLLLRKHNVCVCVCVPEGLCLILSLEPTTLKLDQTKAQGKPAVAPFVLVGFMTFFPFFYSSHFI